MQAGFTALESGLLRSKNSINVAIKTSWSRRRCSGCSAFGLMFGSDDGGLVGTSSFLCDGDGTFQTAFFLFELGFIGTATTLMSGAVAERMRFGGYLILAVFVAAVSYPVFGHWAWGNGWLSELGFVDFAGSTVVHSVGGWMALAAIIILGPRIGRFAPGAVPIRAARSCRDRTTPRARRHRQLCLTRLPRRGVAACGGYAVTRRRGEHGETIIRIDARV
jgi:Amt family ammonium transporter